VNSSSQSKVKPGSVASSRRRKPGATVQTSSHAVSGTSAVGDQPQFQQPRGQRVRVD